MPSPWYLKKPVSRILRSVGTQFKTGLRNVATSTRPKGTSILNPKKWYGEHKRAAGGGFRMGRRIAPWLGYGALYGAYRYGKKVARPEQLNYSLSSGDMQKMIIGDAMDRYEAIREITRRDLLHKIDIRNKGRTRVVRKGGKIQKAMKLIDEIVASEEYMNNHHKMRKRRKFGKFINLVGKAQARKILRKQGW